MGLTDTLIRKIRDELEHRRGTIDNDLTITRVTIIATLDPRSGRVDDVSWRPEYRRQKPASE